MASAGDIKSHHQDFAVLISAESPDAWAELASVLRDTGLCPRFCGLESGEASREARRTQPLIFLREWRGDSSDLEICSELRAIYPWLRVVAAAADDPAAHAGPRPDSPEAVADYLLPLPADMGQAAKTLKLALNSACRGYAAIRDARIEGTIDVSRAVADRFSAITGGIRIGVGMLASRIPKDDELPELVRGIEHIADKGTALIGRLQALSTQPPLPSECVRIEKILNIVLAERFSGQDERFEILRETLDAAPALEVDALGLKQCLQSVITNAAESMPDGGKVMIESAVVQSVELPASLCPGLSPGMYVRLSVSDSGPGMEPDVARRIFDPFFTTNPSPDRLGLEMTAAYAFVRNSKGAMELFTRPGAGTRMDIYLPVTRHGVHIRDIKRPDSGAGRGMILVVDDDKLVRTTIEKALRSNGYEVVAAEDGRAAVDAFRAMHREIGLAIVDFLLPILSGPATCTELRSINPGVRLIMVTGYGVRRDSEEIRRLQLDAFLQKPFRMKELAETVAECLARNGAARNGAV
ncbi:MAG TPA: response regulator [Candidatus Brocadiia bacterium]|nr:response regulator [Candidatus Brocadiia bacterium]